MTHGKTIMAACAAMLVAAMTIGAGPVVAEEDAFSFPPEWEEQETVWVGWVPRGAAGPQPEGREAAQIAIRAQMVEALTRHGTVTLLIQPSAIGEAREALEAAGADLDRVSFFEHETIDFYFRDAGPRFVSDGESLKIADFKWTCYGFLYPLSVPGCYDRATLDNDIAGSMGIGAIDSTVAIEGGAIDITDTLMMTYRDTLLRRNPSLSLDEIEAELLRLYGKEKVIWLDTAPYSDRPGKKVANYFGWGANGHVDEYARFVSNDTVLVAQAGEGVDNPLSNSDREVLAQNRRQLEAATDADGNPLTVIAMPAPDIGLFAEAMPKQAWFEEMWPGVSRDYEMGETIYWTPAASYMNFVIANGVIIVPAYWQEGLPESVREDDEKARSILADAFPEREIVQLNVLPVNFLGGGMHCMTQQQPAL